MFGKLRRADLQQSGQKVTPNQHADSESASPSPPTGRRPTGGAEDRKDEDRLRLLSSAVEQCQDGLAIADLEGIIKFVNPAFAAIHGYTPEELYGKHLSIFHTPEQMSAIEEANRILFEKGTFSGEIWHRRKDGTPFPTMMRNAVLRDSNGEAIGFIGTLSDISDLKKTEEALRDSEARYRTLFDRVPVGLYRSTPSGQILAANRALVRMLGFPDRESLLKMNAQALYAEATDRSRLLEEIDRSSVALDLEMQLRRYDGVTIWVKENARTICDSHGTVLYYEGSLEDITERKRAEEALRLSEERHRTLQANVPIGVLRTTLEGEFLSANPALVRMLGCTSEEEVLRTPARAFWTTAQRRQEFLEQLRAHGSVTDFEMQIRRKNGANIWVSLSARATLDEEGEIAFLDGVARDISERKRAEEDLRRAHDNLERRVEERTSELTAANRRLQREIIERERIDQALRASEARFRTIVDASKDAMIAIDRRGIITIFNPAAERMFGRKTEQMVGQSLDGLMPEDHRRSHQENVRSFFETGKPNGAIGQTIELPALRSDGTVFPIELSLSVGKFADERFVLAVIRDVSRRKQDEAALRDSEAKIRALVETTSDWIWEVDQDARYTYSSPKAKDLLGYDPDEILGKSPFDLMPPEVAKSVRKKFERDAEAKRPFANLENVNLHKDGHQVVLETSGVPILDSEGNLSGYRGIDRDITARKRAAEELKKAKEAAEAANRAKSRFLANMSHEIRTPITAMLGAAELLSRPGHERHLYERAETILRNGRHLLALIDDVLDLSRLEAGQLKMHITQTSLLEIMADVRAITEPLRQGNDVEFQITFESPIPSAIQTDPVRLKQAVINLVNNALKYTEAGHVWVRVRVNTEGGEPRLSIAVEDTGIGIPESELENIFDVFAQVETGSRPASGGVGLGLPLTRWIAQQLGGNISVQSKPGHGSTFTLRVGTGPVDDQEWMTPQAIAASPLTESPETDSTSHQQMQGSVLLAEDFRDARELIEHALRSAGAQVTTVENGKEAVKVATGRPFDLILMDIRMPVMSGLEATRELRRRGCLTPIIALTASTGEDEQKRILEAGFDDLWTKPISLKGIVEGASAYLGAPEGAEEEEPKTAPSPTEPMEPDPALRAVVAQFVRDLPGRYERIRSAVENSDQKSAREALHQLVGTAGIVGFMPLSEAANQLLTKIKKTSCADSIMELDALGAMVDAIVRSHGDQQTAPTKGA
jgi:PAS domain S-box-containing protein